MVKSTDPQIQLIHRENADRILLASFISCLIMSPGHQVRVSHVRCLEGALKIGLSVQESERQERFNESFYTRSEKSVRLLSEPKDRPDLRNGNRRHSGEPRANRQARSQNQSAPANKNRAEPQEKRGTRTAAAVRCYECDGRGHFARECPTRLKKRINSLIHEAGNSRPNVPSVRTRQAIRKKPRLRETRARRRGRQLSPPHCT